MCIHSNLYSALECSEDIYILLYFCLWTSLEESIRSWVTVSKTQCISVFHTSHGPLLHHRPNVLCICLVIASHLLVLMVTPMQKRQILKGIKCPCGSINSFYYFKILQCSNWWWICEIIARNKEKRQSVKAIVKTKQQVFCVIIISVEGLGLLFVLYLHDPTRSSQTLHPATVK